MLLCDGVLLRYNTSHDRLRPTIERATESMLMSKI